MTKHNQEVGRRGERLAAEYLQHKGMTILEQNYHIRRGEADIIAKDGDTIVFVEVKSRSSLRYGSGAEAIDSRKQKALLRTAQLYLYRNGLQDAPARFDVVEIFFGEQTHLKYLKNVIFG